MAQESTLHIKLDRNTDEKLKLLAYSRKTSKGQLVREAISACYQTSIEQLSLPQQQALMACQGGFISVNKLANIMGMHALAMRKWLADHGIEVPAAYGAEDAKHA